MNSRRFRPATVRVPCSTSNLGAGFDCIGLALQRHLHVGFVPEVAETLVTDFGGTLTGLERGEVNGPEAAAGPGAPRFGALGGPSFTREPHNLLTRTFAERMRALGAMRVVGRLTATSDIPVARGLGSSAAAVVAGILLADAVFGHEPDLGTALTLATEREGHPDNAAPALLGGLVAVARREGGAPVAFRLPLSDQIAFAYAAPAVEIPTPAARAALPGSVPHALAARGLGRMAALLQGLATADPTLLRLGLLDELHVPFRLPLIPRAQQALRAAEAAGAWGATISGAGSGLIALCAADRAAAVLEAMERELAADGVATTAFIAAADAEGAKLLEPEQAPRSERALHPHNAP
jgi:homoserine kinase